MPPTLGQHITVFERPILRNWRRSLGSISTSGYGGIGEIGIILSSFAIWAVEALLGCGVVVKRLLRDGFSVELVKREGDNCESCEEEEHCATILCLIHVGCEIELKSEGMPEYRENTPAVNSDGGLSVNHRVYS